MKKSTLLFVSCFVIVIFFTLLSNREEQVQEHPSLEAIQLVDPEMAPPSILGQVLAGRRIMNETRKYAGSYTNDRLECSHCHFNGGNTLGGRENGFPLVGVEQKYPLFLKELGRAMTLTERINHCFERSMNGKALPKDSEEMLALLEYMKWISTPVADLKERPWLERKFIKSSHIGDPKAGRESYVKYCAECHGQEGMGKEEFVGDTIPPLWGPNSFNDAAGMHEQPLFSLFIFENMPKGAPFLTEDEALDIAAFVTQMPRPKFK